MPDAAIQCQDSRDGEDCVLKRIGILNGFWGCVSVLAKLEVAEQREAEPYDNGRWKGCFQKKKRRERTVEVFLEN